MQRCTEVGNRHFHMLSLSCPSTGLPRNTFFFFFLLSSSSALEHKPAVTAMPSNHRAAVQYKNNYFGFSQKLTYACKVQSRYELSTDSSASSTPKALIKANATNPALTTPLKKYYLKKKKVKSQIQKHSLSRKISSSPVVLSQINL